MTRYVSVAIGEFFLATNGRAKFIKDFIDAHGGAYPVYSASLVKPFGFVDEFEYSGHYLTWVMNGYGGRVQEISGQFSINRDRGILIPREGIQIPDLTYLRFALEPQLMAAAVGRRVDGRLNEYTKIYPDAASAVEVQVPLTEDESYDFARMAKLGERFRRIEKAQIAVKQAREPLVRAVFPLEVAAPSISVSLGDSTCFELSIGKRVLRIEHADDGIPVYSANALTPFGKIARSNLTNFDKPSLLWGIDGNFEWNFVPAGQPFATTDHCGRLQVVNDQLDPYYIYWYLKTTQARYGFDRVFRAKLENMREEVSVDVPVNESGEPSMVAQGNLARLLQKREEARLSALAALDDVLKARMSVEV